MQRESNIILLEMYLFCIFYAIDFGPPGIAHDSLRSYRGLALREVDLGMQSLRSGDALTAFGGGLRSAGPSCPDHVNGRQD